MCLVSDRVRNGGGTGARAVVKREALMLGQDLRLPWTWNWKQKRRKLSSMPSRLVIIFSSCFFSTSKFFSVQEAPEPQEDFFRERIVQHVSSTGV